MNKLKISLVGALASALLLTTVACSTSALIGTLNAVVVTADAAVASLAATGIVSPIEATLAENYLSAISSAVSATATEMASTDAGSVKSAKVAAIFAKALLPDVKSFSPMIGAALRAVDAAVQAFLQAVHPSGVSANALDAIAPKPSMSDHHQLMQIRKHAEALKAKLAKLQ